MVEINVVEHGAVQLKNIVPAVVIVVHELHGNAAQGDSFVADAGAKRIVVEGSIFVVEVKAIQFEIEVSDVDVLPAVAVDVGGVDAHARLVTAVFAGGHAGNERDIFKRSIVIIEKKKIRPRIIRDGDVSPAVVVEVGEYDPHALGFGLS